MSAVPVTQEVIKLDLIECERTTPVRVAEQNTNITTSLVTSSIAAEIECGNLRVRLFNSADPLVIQNTLKGIGGAFHA